MPIWLRKFTFNKLKEHFSKQNNTTTDWVEDAKPVIHQPSIPNSSTYHTKSTKKS